MEVEQYWVVRFKFYVGTSTRARDFPARCAGSTEPSRLARTIVRLKFCDNKSIYSGHFVLFFSPTLTLSHWVATASDSESPTLKMSCTCIAPEDRQFSRERDVTVTNTLSRLSLHIRGFAEASHSTHGENAGERLELISTFCRECPIYVCAGYRS